MKCFLLLTTSFLLVELISSHIIPASNSSSGINEDTLVFANVIFRHGARDMDNKIALTNDGKRQLYILGEYFSRRYKQILGEHFSRKKVYVLSTDYDRSIMSALANLAGFFKPTDDEVWDETIRWQPVPIHTLPRKSDIILRPRYGDRCPKYGEMYDWFMTKSPDAVEMQQKFGHLFPYWRLMSGEEINTIEDIFSIYKKIIADRDAGKELKQWEETAIIPNGPMDQIAKIVYKIRGNPKLARVRCGFLIKEMLERFSKKVDGSLKKLSLFMYSAHSSTITTLMNGLRLDQEDIPEHGSSFQLELYRNSDGEYYLQLFLRKPDEEFPEPKEIPGCGKSCPLDKFYSIYEELIPGEFEDECQNYKTPSKSPCKSTA